MPFPTPQSPSTALQAERGGFGVFISYSRNDGQLASDFVKQLRLLVRNDASLRVDPDRVFFDQNAILAGESWRQRIRASLDESDVFILLISADALLSPTIVELELATAVRLQLHIVPVLLSDAAGWDRQATPGHRNGVQLSEFHAVPTHGVQGRPLPVTDAGWGAPAAALARAVEQIGLALAGLVKTPRVLTDDRQAQRRPLRPLLPNLCNQGHAVSRFRNALRDWEEPQGLVVLVKGVSDDDPIGFWRRLNDEDLSSYGRGRGVELARPRTLILPPLEDLGLAPDEVADKLGGELMQRLSEALVGRSGRLRDAGDLAAFLATDAAMLPLLVSLSTQPREDAATLLRSLLGLFEQLPAAPSLRRLVLVVLVDDPALVAERELAQTLGLGQAWQRLRVAELLALRPLTPQHVKEWHREHQLDEVLHLDEQQLVEQLFEAGDQLRHYPFKRRVKPLLDPYTQESAP